MLELITNISNSEITAILRLTRFGVETTYSQTRPITPEDRLIPKLEFEIEVLQWALDQFEIHIATAGEIAHIKTGNTYIDLSCKWAKSRWTGHLISFSPVRWTCNNFGRRSSFCPWEFVKLRVVCIRRESILLRIPKSFRDKLILIHWSICEGSQSISRYIYLFVLCYLVW